MKVQIASSRITFLTTSNALSPEQGIKRFQKEFFCFGLIVELAAAKSIVLKSIPVASSVGRSTISVFLYSVQYAVKLSGPLFSVFSVSASTDDASSASA